MRVIGYIIAGCLALAVLRFAILVLALLCLVSFLWGSYTQPKAMLGFIALCIVAKVAATYPAATFVCIVFCLGIAWLSGPPGSVRNGDG